MHSQHTGASPTYRRFGLRLRVWRSANSLTLKQLALKIQGSDSYLVGIEGGIKPPPLPDTAIGHRLYGVINAEPLPQEHFLWARIRHAEATFQTMALFVLMHYAGNDDSDPTHPRSLGQIALPSAVDAEAMIETLGGPDVLPRDYVDRSTQIPVPVVVDWLLQTTYALGFDFYPFLPSSVASSDLDHSDLDRPVSPIGGDHHDVVALRAFVRWPRDASNRNESISMPGIDLNAAL